jgi:hypothetical protein
MRYESNTFSYPKICYLCYLCYFRYRVTLGVTFVNWLVERIFRRKVTQVTKVTLCLGVTLEGHL